MPYSIVFLIHICVLCCCLGGCSSDSSADGSDDIGGISGTGIDYSVKSMGTITGYQTQGDSSAFYIGETLYQLSDDRILFNGIESSAAVLSVGMLVSIEGQRQSADGPVQVSLLSYNDKISGYLTQIEKVDAQSYQMTILQQKIVVNAQTYLDQINMDVLQAGDYVIVSGWPGDDQQWHASYISLGDAAVSPRDSLEGLVMDAQQGAFTLNGIQVRYSPGSKIDVPLENGQAVFVVGQFSETDNALLAERIHPAKDALSYQNDVQDKPLYITGQITGLEGDSRLQINYREWIDISLAEIRLPPDVNLQQGLFVEVVAQLNVQTQQLEAELVKVLGDAPQPPKGGFIRLFDRFEGYTTEPDQIQFGPNRVNIAQATFFPEPFELQLGMMLEINAKALQPYLFEAVEIRQAEPKPPRRH